MTFNEDAARIGEMATRLINEDPNLEYPMEYRIAAFKIAAEILVQELGRQALLVSMHNLLKKS